MKCLHTGAEPLLGPLSKGVFLALGSQTHQVCRTGALRCVLLTLILVLSTLGPFLEHVLPD